MSAFSNRHCRRFIVSCAASALGLGSIIFTERVSPTVEAGQSQMVNQGVYSTEQAQRGQALYKDQCAPCHGANLGGDIGPPLTGNDFVSVWEKQPLSALFNKIRRTMPQDEPGKLTGEQVADIVAYVLQASKFPTGQTSLSADENVLNRIAWGAGSTAPVKSAAVPATVPALQATGNMAQLMRGLLFPTSNLIFNVQNTDPGGQKVGWEPTKSAFSWVDWGAGIYSGWEMVDNAAVTISDAAPLLLQPRRCENGKPAPVERPDWIKFTQGLTDAGRIAFKASQSRNRDAVIEATNDLAGACLNCHEVYRDKPGGGAADPSNKAARCVP
jgi:mono/diheme cytochrome c family protein